MIHQRNGPPVPSHVRDESTHRNEVHRNELYKKFIQEFSSSIVEPSEMLRDLQSKILRGWPLDVAGDVSVLIEDTNFIAVDRDNILQTTTEELRSVKDPRITFQVVFYKDLQTNCKSQLMECDALEPPLGLYLSRD